MQLDPTFAGGYYLAIVLLIFIIVLSIRYQSIQVWRYFSRNKWPVLIDLPTTSREKAGKLAAYELNGEVGRMSMAVVPESHVMYSTGSVWMHKIWNSAFHVVGFESMEFNELVLLLLFIALNLTFLLLPFESDASTASDLVNRAAHIALANSAFVFPLATRNSVFVTLIGVPFERIIKFHRWTGRMIFFMIALHGGTQIQQQYSATESINQALFGDNQHLTGSLAFLSIIIIVIMSHAVIRRFAFEAFWWTHFTFIFFIIFGALHTSWFAPYVAFGISLYVVDRLIRFVKSNIKSTKVVNIEPIQTGVTRVVFERDMHYEAGQYAFVNFPNLNAPVSLVTWHPVSLSSAPSIEDDGIPLHTVHLKAAGGFTQKLYEKARSQSGMSPGLLRMKFDGPYGKPSLEFSEQRTVMLVAGGIGVTPMISILRDLVDKQLSGLPLATQAIYFIWVIPDIDSYAWFASELQELLHRASALPDNKYIIDVKVFLTRSQTTPSSIFFQGRPSFDFLLKSVKDFHGSGDIAVGVCGPAVMIKEVKNSAMARSDRYGLVNVHSETYEL